MPKKTFLASTLALAVSSLVSAVTVTGGCVQPDPPRVVSHADPQPAEAQGAQNEDGDGGAYCQHRRFPCWPWMGGDLTCSTACGYTAQCIWYTDFEVWWCATHKGQYMPGHGQCTKGGDCWWNTYCVDWRISVAPGGTESTAADPSQAVPPELPDARSDAAVDPNQPSTAAYPDVN